MDSNMYQIPYIEHKKRMFKAYQRERRLKYALAITNALWIIMAVISYAR